MEVSHREDLVTHAVITTNEAQSFGMSDSAEFFNILSSTLYKDQHRAVIRETLCNAWDAHIDAGVTHLPIEVTLTDERLVIRDFGKGIPDDKMRDRYCVYGSSTKAHDGKQTGGFGLGCKAPFAYADHFEVISNHGGTKSIYNMSKSNAQAGGKPGMIKLASLPTEETGLQVSIDIKSSQDRMKFQVLIQSVTMQGDLRVKLNGHMLPTLGFDLSKSNVMLVPASTFPDFNQVYVRYGNVIYPIEHSDATNANKEEVKTFLKSLVAKNDSNNAPYLILQAPPHSISVQPSREGLSMKEHTTSTLNRLMTDFLKKVKQEFLPACLKIRAADIAAQVREGDLVQLLDARRSMFDANDKYNHRTRSVPNHLLKVQTMEQIAQRAMAVRPPEIPGYAEKDLALRIQGMAQADLINKGLASTFLRELANQVKDEKHSSDWLTRRVLAPLVLATNEAGLMGFRLYVKHRYQNNGTINDTLTGAAYYKESRLTAVAPFLRNILVVTHKMTNLELRMHKCPELQDKGAMAKVLVYHCGTGKADKEKALAFFRTQPGLVVIDLTQNQGWEVLSRTPPGPKKPKVEGLPAFSNIWWQDENEVQISRFLRDDAVRVTNPEFVCIVSLASGEPTRWLSGWTGSTTRILAEMFGARGAIVNHRGKYDTAIKNGAMDLRTFVYQFLHHEMTTNPRIQKHLQMMPQRLIHGDPDNANSRNAWDLLDLAYKNPMLQKAFTLPKPLLPRDEQILALWNHAIKPFQKSYRTPPELLGKVLAHIEAQPINQLALQMAQNMNSSPLMGVLDLSSLERRARYAEKGSPEAKQLNTVMQLLFNP